MIIRENTPAEQLTKVFFATLDHLDQAEIDPHKDVQFISNDGIVIMYQDDSTEQIARRIIDRAVSEASVSVELLNTFLGILENKLKEKV